MPTKGICSFTPEDAIDVVNGTRSRHRSAMGWVGDGENRNVLAAVHESLDGTYEN
jgi:hypothetical protein